MALADKIKEDTLAALKAGDATKRQVLGMVTSALGNARIAKKVEQLADSDALVVLAKEAKSRRDAAVEFRKGGAEDRAKAEEAEAAIIEAYLPAQMSDADLEKAVAATLAKLKVTDAKQMGKVMGVLSKELRGRADLKKVNALVRAKLGA
ncbi:MAG: GatB/YqeY domain-containing protein [Candidatus Andersenbacteria bacterium]